MNEHHRDCASLLAISWEASCDCPNIAIEEAACELLDAMREAEGARGVEDKQYARQDVTAASEKLRKALASAEALTHAPAEGG